MEFKKASKTATRLRVGISGASGSGKTYSALKIASGIGGKIAVIDTERGSAALYADKFDFDTVQIEPPYTPDKNIEAIKLAELSGYGTIIVDSLSHAWAGSGGLLDMHDAIQKSSKGGNSFTAWKEITPLQNKLLDTITGSTCHIIVTMRAKQDYVIESNNGRNQVRKVGLAAVQREGVEYEFSVYIELSQDHIGVATKDRTDLFDGKCFVPSEQTGRQLVEWLNKPATPSAAVAPNEPQTPKPTATTATNTTPAEAQVPSPKTVRQAPSAQITIQDIAKVLSPELKTLFNARRLTTGHILTIWRELDGDQQ
ncbi:MAG TPA: ATP-binding protein, partial [Oligoflexia bacterium]|nr:ATP-binding protein [Oligoflexia bacterium]